jgi:hypothetical protein
VHAEELIRFEANVLRGRARVTSLYGQRPLEPMSTAVTERSCIRSGVGDTYLVLRDQPVLLPPPLAALTIELAACSTHEQSTTAGTGNRPWLFPGTRPGSHFYAGRLSASAVKHYRLGFLPWGHGLYLRDA